MKKIRAAKDTGCAALERSPLGRTRLRVSWPAFRVPLIGGVAGVLLMLAMAPNASPQYPIPPIYPTPPLIAGGSPGAMLRSGVAELRNQANLTRQAASDWKRRANSATYNAQQFEQDYTHLQFRFASVRQQFNAVGNVALQLGRPRANNTVAELDAGLTIIGELFTFLETQYNAGTLDRQTIVRTCRVFEDALREWERELSKKDSRLGVTY